MGDNGSSAPRGATAAARGAPDDRAARLSQAPRTLGPVAFGLGAARSRGIAHATRVTSSPTPPASALPSLSSTPRTLKMPFILTRAHLDPILAAAAAGDLGPYIASIDPAAEWRVGASDEKGTGGSDVYASYPFSRAGSMVRGRGDRADLDTGARLLCEPADVRGGAGALPEQVPGHFPQRGQGRDALHRGEHPHGAACGLYPSRQTCSMSPYADCGPQVFRREPRKWRVGQGGPIPSTVSAPLRIRWSALHLCSTDLWLQRTRSICVMTEYSAETGLAVKAREYVDTEKGAALFAAHGF